MWIDVTMTTEWALGIVVLMTRKSGSGDGGCACGLIKLIIEIDLPSNWLKYEKRALHILFYLLYVTFYSTSNAQINVMSTLRVLLLFSFVWASFSISLRLSLYNVKYTWEYSLVLSCWPSLLFLTTHVIRHYTTILMTAAVFCHSQVDPWAFHRLEERQRKYVETVHQHHAI